MRTTLSTCAPLLLLGGCGRSGLPGADVISAILVQSSSVRGEIKSKGISFDVLQPDPLFECVM